MSAHIAQGSIRLEGVTRQRAKQLSFCPTDGALLCTSGGRDALLWRIRTVLHQQELHMVRLQLPLGVFRC